MQQLCGRRPAEATFCCDGGRIYCGAARGGDRNTGTGKARFQSGASRGPFPASRHHGTGPVSRYSRPGENQKFGKAKRTSFASMQYLTGCRLQTSLLLSPAGRARKWCAPHCGRAVFVCRSAARSGPQNKITSLLFSLKSV